MIPAYSAENILVGIETKDDAAVFLVSENIAAVQTVDFFTPIVNDPYLFGQIAAANSLSDIYAMGLEPAFALSIAAFPCSIGMDILSRIVQGGIDKMNEAGVPVIGGHSIDDTEPKYGFVVNAFTEPYKIIRNSTAKPGNLLYATKPLGTGVIATAIKADIVNEDEVMDQLEQVIRLNKAARDAAVKARATALTDITGFGLLGHAYEMASGSGLSLEVYASNAVIYEKAYELASYGIMPAGLHDNKKYLGNKFTVEDDIDQTLIDILFDPQTSGGLLIAVEEENQAVLEEELSKAGEKFYLAGRFVKGNPGEVKLHK